MLFFFFFQNPKRFHRAMTNRNWKTTLRQIFFFFFFFHSRRNPPRQWEILKRRRSEGMSGAKNIFRIVWIFFGFPASSSRVCVCGGGGDQRNVVAPLFYFPFGCFLLLYSSMGDGSFGSLSVVSRVVQDRRVDVRAGGDWVRLGLALYLLLLLPGRPSRKLQPPKQLVAPWWWQNETPVASCLPTRPWPLGGHRCY